MSLPTVLSPAPGAPQAARHSEPSDSSSQLAGRERVSLPPDLAMRAAVGIGVSATLANLDIGTQREADRLAAWKSSCEDGMGYAQTAEEASASLVRAPDATDRQWSHSRWLLGALGSATGVTPHETSGDAAAGRRLPPEHLAGDPIWFTDGMGVSSSAVAVARAALSRLSERLHRSTPFTSHPLMSLPVVSAAVQASQGGWNDVPDAAKESLLAVRSMRQLASVFRATFVAAVNASLVAVAAESWDLSRSFGWTVDKPAASFTGLCEQLQSAYGSGRPIVGKDGGMLSGDAEAGDGAASDEDGASEEGGPSGVTSHWMPKSLKLTSIAQPVSVDTALSVLNPELPVTRVRRAMRLSMLEEGPGGLAEASRGKISTEAAFGLSKITEAFVAELTLRAAQARPSRSSASDLSGAAVRAALQRWPEADFASVVVGPPGLSCGVDFGAIVIPPLHSTAWQDSTTEAVSELPGTWNQALGGAIAATKASLVESFPPLFVEAMVPLEKEAPPASEPKTEAAEQEPWNELFSSGGSSSSQAQAQQHHLAGKEAALAAISVVASGGGLVKKEPAATPPAPSEEVEWLDWVPTQVWSGTALQVLEPQIQPQAIDLAARYTEHAVGWTLGLFQPDDDVPGQVLLAAADAAELLVGGSAPPEAKRARLTAFSPHASGVAALCESVAEAVVTGSDVGDDDVEQAPPALPALMPVIDPAVMMQHLWTPASLFDVLRWDAPWYERAAVIAAMAQVDAERRGLSRPACFAAAGAAASTLSTRLKACGAVQPSLEAQAVATVVTIFGSLDRPLAVALGLQRPQTAPPPPQPAIPRAAAPSPKPPSAGTASDLDRLLAMTPAQRAALPRVQQQQITLLQQLQQLQRLRDAIDNGSFRTQGPMAGAPSSPLMEKARAGDPEATGKLRSAITMLMRKTVEDLQKLQPGNEPGGSQPSATA
jgi:hypothetical protein